jgi:hypothetical protein
MHWVVLMMLQCDVCSSYVWTGDWRMGELLVDGRTYVNINTPVLAVPGTVPFLPVPVPVPVPPSRFQQGSSPHIPSPRHPRIISPPLGTNLAFFRPRDVSWRQRDEIYLCSLLKKDNKQ